MIAALGRAPFVGAFAFEAIAAGIESALKESGIQ